MPSYLLQTVNAELARSLASVQWNLEVEVYEILTLVSAEFGNPIVLCFHETKTKHTFSLALFGG